MSEDACRATCSAHGAAACAYATGADHRHWHRVHPEASPCRWYAEEPGRGYRKERDLAYTERNRLVAALARILTASARHPIPEAAPNVAWLAEHDPADAGWDPEWRTIVFIEGPTGQMSWHLHNSDVPLFDGLPRGPNLWDGHTTPQKYERLARVGRGPGETT